MRSPGISSRLMLCFLMLFAVCMMASASKPSFSVQHNFDSDSSNTEVGSTTKYGSIVFVKQSYITEEHVVDDIKNFTFEQYDTIRWTGNPVTIERGGDTVTSLNSVTQTYKFTNMGVYTISSVNGSESASINIVKAVVPQIHLDSQSSPGINFSFSKDSVTLDASSKVVSVNISIDDGINPGQYSTTFEYTSDDAHNSSYTFMYDVVRRKRWNVLSSNITQSVTATTADITDAGTVTFENVGNQRFEIGLNVSGEGSKFINVPSSQTLYRDSTMVYPVQVQIPSNQELGKYPVTLEFYGADKQTLVKHMNITVRDRIHPNIDSIEFRHDYVMLNNTITVVAKDNLGVRNVSITYGDEEHYFNKDQQVFTYNTIFRRLSRYVFNVCAYDEDNNSECSSFNKTFEKLDFIDSYGESRELPSVKHGKFAESPMFNLSKDTDNLKIRLMDFSVDADNLTRKNVTIRLIDGDGTVKNFNRYVNEIKVENAGTISLEVRSPRKTGYDGRLSFIAPEYIDTPNDIYFSGDFKEYEVPQSFEKEWFDGKNLDCDVVDTGDLSTTYYDCRVKLHSSIDKDNLPIPITPSEKRQIESEHADEISKYENKLGVYRVIVGILLGFVFIGTLVVVIFVNYAPYVRLAFSVNERHEENAKNKK